MLGRGREALSLITHLKMANASSMGAPLESSTKHGLSWERIDRKAATCITMEVRTMSHCSPCASGGVGSRQGVWR